MPSKLIVATHNRHKTEEIQAMLGELFEEIVDLKSFPDAPVPEETGITFAENSAIKALAWSELDPGALVLADDSGLEVDALGGQPGVYSSRYAGEDATDADNRDKLLTALSEHKDPTDRTARFRCVITIARQGKIEGTFDGTVEGTIACHATGGGGFGYDPVFLPEGHAQSFGELPATTKNALSHRSRALEKFRQWWQEERPA